jgi:tetratricopeptide (TPR) repeat protein
MKQAIMLSVALAAVMPHVAHAEPPPATIPSDRVKQAQGLADQAYDAYQREDWSKAITLYLESYKLAPTADVLFNVASIYDKRIKDKELALEYYRRHNASTDATPELVGKATARISELNRTDKASKSPAPREEPRRPQEHSGSSLPVAGLITAGAGVLGLGAGALFGLSAISKHNEAKTAGCSGSTCLDAGGQGSEKDASKDAAKSTIFFIAGGALAATGVTLYLLAPKSKEGSAPQAASSSVWLAPAVGPSVAGVSVAGTIF